MRPNFKNTIKKLSGNTSDIVSVVMETYNKDWQQVRELAPTFGNAGTTREICKNIFDYIIENVRYKEDPPGVQWVKTPARLLADGVGDCKSMSIFTASCLRVLGIDHFFRFVSFNRRKDATHVYVVALIPDTERSRSVEGTGNREIIIDPVVRPVQFDKEEKYTYKSDMRGTDIYYLSGIRQSVGEVQTPDLWFGENPNDYSKHKMSLLSFLDLKLSESGIAASQHALATIYNELDILSLAVFACENSADKDELADYFRHIAGMKVQEAFKNLSTDLNARSLNLAELKTVLQSRINTLEYYSYDADLFAWLDANCLALYSESISGIGNVSRAQEAAQKIKQSGPYYMYTFIPHSMDHKYPVKVLRKKAIQKNVYNWVDETDGYNSSAIQANLVRSGIINSTGMTPEQFLSGKNLKTWRIGEPITIATIIGIVSALISVIKLLRDIFGNKRPAPTDAEINNGLADYSVDLGSGPVPSLPSAGEQIPAYTEKPKSAFPLAAAGLAALFFLKK